MSALSGIVIRAMRVEDLAFAAACTAAEGWVSENRSTLDGFFIHDRNNCLIAEEAGERLGICIATEYAKYGFIGELIVKPEARGRGIGAALLNHAIRLLMAHGVETVYLDGVLKAVGLYERNGFRKICRSWRFSGHLVSKTYGHVRLMEKSDLHRVIFLDRAAFGADRSFFLKRRFNLFPELCWVRLDSEEISGYIMGRRGTGWVSAGPWIVRQQIDDPADLMKAVALSASDSEISLGILDANHPACELVRGLGLVERADSPWRMALGVSNHLGASSMCFAIGSAAKG